MALSVPPFDDAAGSTRDPYCSNQKAAIQNQRYRRTLDP